MFLHIFFTWNNYFIIMNFVMMILRKINFDMMWYSVIFFVTHSLTHGTFNFFGHISIFLDAFYGFHLEIYKKAISNDGCRSENSRYISVREFWIISDFRELNFCGPCGDLIFSFFTLQCMNVYFTYDLYTALKLKYWYYMLTL